MECVVLWAALVELIAPVLSARLYRQASFFACSHAANLLLAAMVTLSDAGVKQAYFDTPLHRELA